MHNYKIGQEIHLGSFYLTFYKLLGQGSFGVVYQVQDKQYKVYALKVQQGMSDDEEKITQLIKDSKPKGIVQIFEFQNDNGIYLILMEYLPNNFYEIISQENIQENDLRYIFKQLAETIQSLHKLNIAHRDLKPENILVEKIGDRQNQLAFKLCDFGISKLETQELFKTMNIGTPYYQAPEQIGQDKAIAFDKSVDIWALGAIYYETITKKPLFNGQSIEEVQRLIKDRNHSIKQINNLSVNDEFKKLILQMVEFDVQKRITLDKIMLILKPRVAKSPQIRPVQIQTVQNPQSNRYQNMQAEQLIQIKDVGKNAQKISPPRNTEQNLKSQQNQIQKSDQKTNYAKPQNVEQQKQQQQYSQPFSKDSLQIISNDNWKRQEINYAGQQKTNFAPGKPVKIFSDISMDQQSSNQSMDVKQLNDQEQNPKLKIQYKSSSQIRVPNQQIQTNSIYQTKQNQNLTTQDLEEKIRQAQILDNVSAKKNAEEQDNIPIDASQQSNKIIPKNSSIKQVQIQAQNKNQDLPIQSSNVNTFQLVPKSIQANQVQNQKIIKIPISLSVQKPPKVIPINSAPLNGKQEQTQQKHQIEFNNQSIQKIQFQPQQNYFGVKQQESSNLKVFNQLPNPDLLKNEFVSKINRIDSKIPNKLPFQGAIGPSNPSDRQNNFLQYKQPQIRGGYHIPQQ